MDGSLRYPFLGINVMKESSRQYLVIQSQSEDLFFLSNSLLTSVRKSDFSPMRYKMYEYRGILPS